MAFHDKYISTTEAGVVPPEGMIVLSDDAYAIGDMIDQLLNKLDMKIRI